jgi:hypothetical protein
MPSLPKAKRSTQLSIKKQQPLELDVGVAGETSSAESLPAETATATAAKVLSHTPNWKEWSHRPSASIRDAVCLAVNVFPSEAAIASLIEAKDPRIKGLGRKFKTAATWLEVPGGLTPLRRRHRTPSSTESPRNSWRPFGLSQAATSVA